MNLSNSQKGYTKPQKLKCLHITTIDLTAYCFLRSWFSYLSQHGFQVTLASTVQEFKKEIEDTGAQVVNIPIARSVNPVSDFISFIKLRNFIKKEKFHSVHTYTTKAGFIGRLAAKTAGVPIVIHTIFELPQNSARNPLLKFLYQKMEQTAAKWADFLITISNFNLNQILQCKVADKEKLHLIPEGIAPEIYERAKINPAEKKKELNLPLDSFVIGTVARLEAAKGHTYLLKAFNELLLSMESFQDTSLSHIKDKLYLVLIGKGRLEESLKEEAKKLGIADRVIFTGFRDDMREILQTFNIFALPSLWEGQGVVLLEAMYYGIPVAASRVGGITDVVEEGVSGLLFPPANPQAISEALLQLASDPAKAEQMGMEGRKRVFKLFLDEDANKKRFTVYKKAYKEKLKIELDYHN